MTRKIAFLLFNFFIVNSFYGQLGGNAVYEFLNLVSSPRQVALGGKIITNQDYDVLQAIYNPATINDQMHNQVGLSYVDYFSDITYGSVAYAHSFKFYDTFHASVTYLNYGDFDGFDIDGNSTGSFTGQEVAVSTGYAINIPKTDLHFGANAKFISSSLADYNSWGIALDLGLLYVNSNNGLNLALAFRNIGSQLTVYDETQEDLPFEIDFGLSKKLIKAPITLHATLHNLQNWNTDFVNPGRATQRLDGSSEPEVEGGIVDEFTKHLIIGAELFPEKAVSLRVGYNFGRSQELRIEDQRSFSGLSAGFGINFNLLRLSYSYSAFSSEVSVSNFGLQINLDR